jgi:hypothetical protein
MLWRFGSIDMEEFNVGRSRRAYYVARLGQNGYIVSAIRERPSPMPPIPKLTTPIRNALKGGKQDLHGKATPSRRGAWRVSQPKQSYLVKDLS